MKVDKQIEIPAEKRTVLDYRQCDLCSAQTTDKTDWLNETGTVSDYAETRISITHGTFMPEGGFSTETIFDVCPDCFEGKLIPWLKEQGAQARTKERW